LFQLNSTMLDHIEKNKENDNLIWLIGQANMEIRLFYSIVESKIRVSMNEINKDVSNNIEYFKRNSQQYPAMYFPRGYKENFDAKDNVFLNMLLVRRAFVSEYNGYISEVLIHTHYGLKDIQKAIVALENDLSIVEQETTQ